jgi:hypothetical protein
MTSGEEKRYYGALSVQAINYVSDFKTEASTAKTD